MYKLNELKPKEGSKFKKRRVGRGNASGWGQTAGRGHKGQQSRSGGGFYVGFEGGQTPLYKRIPKLRGFKNPFRISFAVVNLSDLIKIEEKVITPEILVANGLLRKRDKLIKVLGDGEFAKAITIKAHKFSKTAKEKIEKAGGKMEIIPMKKVAKKAEPAAKSKED
jgi:large subunit ribosomal protein L15